MRIRSTAFRHPTGGSFAAALVDERLWRRRTKTAFRA
jgi:hypothetical protein